MPSTALYVRQSEDKTGHEAAVQRQERDCRLLAQAKGWDDPELFRDNAFSATNGKTRPEFERLIKGIQSGRIDRVVVWHLDRITRSMRDLTRLIEAGRDSRVNIACVHGVSLDLGDPTGVAVAQILTAIAGMETAHKGQRQKRANRQRAENGRAFWTRRPFGYDRDADGQVYVVEREADAIRRGAEQVLEGATLAGIARGWNAEGLRTTDVRKSQDGTITKAGGLWGVTQLRRLLLNPRYIGKRLYNGEQLGDGAWSAILDEETFRQLEIILTDPRRRTAPDDLNAKHLLSGIAKCGKCGKNMYAAPARGSQGERLVYRCFGGYCMQRGLDDVNNWVISVVVGLLSRPDATRAFVRNDDIAGLQQKAQDLRERRDALAALLADGLMSAAVVREQAANLSRELQGVEAALSDSSALNPVSAVVASKDVRKAWESLPVAIQRQIIRALMVVTVLPAGKGVRFSPSQVRIEPKDPNNEAVI